MDHTIYFKLSQQTYCIIIVAVQFIFVTNGGMNSLMEALYWAVPVLGIPLYGQNMRNMEKIQRSGVGHILEKNEAKDGKKLLTAIRRVLGNPSYARTAREMSREMRSRPDTALERTLHSLESVARRPRRPHQLPLPVSASSLLLHLFFQLHLDIVLTAAALLFLAAYSSKLALFCLLWAGKRAMKRAATVMAAFRRESAKTKKREKKEE